MKKQLAIIDACCSRDLFNSKFVCDWNESFDLIYYSFQTSFISLTSEPIPYSRKLLSFEGKNYSTWYKNILLRELNKSYYNDLLSLQPDNLLIDFYSDVVNGCWQIEGKSFMTYRLKDQKNNAAFYEISDKREIKPLTHYEEYMIWWKKSIDKFINFMDEYLPLTNIVVNVPYFNDQILYSNGKIEKYKEDNVQRYNEIYHEMVDYFSMRGETRVRILDLKRKYYIDPEYIFGGAWIVHYHNNYYKDTISRLYELCKDSDKALLKTSINNLVINGTFKYGSLFYKFWDAHFFITEENGENVVNIREEDNQKEIYAQLWCCDIPMDGNNTATYTISFDCKAETLSNRTIAVIRTFDKEGCFSKAECIEQIIIAWNGEYGDDFVHYSVDIIPKGKFISLGLYCTKNGHISWKNLSVVRNKRESNKEVEYSNVVEKLLIKSSKLLDVNNLQLFC